MIYNLKAYVCRFDNSVITNLTFTWVCAGKSYFNTPAPERNRCVALFPDPVAVEPGSLVELIINPALEDTKTDVKVVLHLEETDYLDNRRELLLEPE